MEMSGQIHAPGLLLQGKGPPVLIHRRVGESQSWSGRGGEEEK
jgi:hypothetical protein